MLENAESIDTKPVVEQIDTSKYTADRLILMDFWGAIRHRPRMYIGSTHSQGLTVMAQDLIFAALQEHRAGFCQDIHIQIYSDGSFSILDNGRASDSGATLTSLMEHPPQSKSRGNRQLCEGYFFGLGPMVPAALSSWLVCEIRDGGRCLQTRCEAPINKRPYAWRDCGCCSGETGLLFHFLPDPAIFGDSTWDGSELLNWLWEQVHLFPGVTITFTDEREGCDPQILCAPEGLREFLAWGLADKTPIHPTIITGSGVHEGMSVELALSFIEGEPTWRMYGCGIPLREGGTPLTGLRTGLARTLGKLAGRSGISFQPEKARLGIAALVSVWTERPIFGAPTKDRLQNPEAEVAVARVVRDALLTHARQYPSEMQAILAAL